MDIEPHSIKDCYRCPECKVPAAYGDKYCRGCGVLFIADHVAEMKKQFHLPVNVLPWNIRDRFRCVFCNASVSIHDSFCRFCGKVFDQSAIKGMKENMSKLAKANGPSAILVFVVLLLFILYLVSSV